MSEQQYGPHQKYSLIVNTASSSSTSQSSSSSSASIKGKIKNGHIINQVVIDPINDISTADLIDYYITDLSDVKKLLEIIVDLTPINSKKLLLQKIHSDFNQS